MSFKYNEYLLTNLKSGNSCIIFNVQPKWIGKRDELIERFKEMERELGVSEFEIRFMRVPKGFSLKRIREREVIKNLWPENDGIDLVYLGGKRV